MCTLGEILSIVTDGKLTQALRVGVGFGVMYPANG
jgi:hypothetical protein